MKTIDTLRNHLKPGDIVKDCFEYNNHRYGVVLDNSQGSLTIVYWFKIDLRDRYKNSYSAYADLFLGKQGCYWSTFKKVSK
ncbi:MAG: hypothetical protein Q8P81_03645 [Nanoarchaeota archaeon]|nr:hypothetical protein [Nanoarchaeota archaeon]